MDILKTIQERLKTIQERKEAFNALPTSEKIRQNRERRVASLLRVGYITPDEAQIYREQLAKLPQDRKGLVVAYFLLGIGSHLGTIQSMEESERIGEIISSFRIQERGLLRDGKTLIEGSSPEEFIRWTEELSRAHIEAEITKAETFVDAKRSRIRAKLLQLHTILIATSLVEDEQEGELGAIPYLREELQKRGYRAEAKSLNNADKEAIQGAASTSIDLLELAFLNGVGILRYEEYRSLKDENGGFKDNFYYRDAYDEALTEFESTYILLDNAVAIFYADGTAREAIDFLNKYYKAMFESDYFTETLRGTKFNYMIEEARR